MTRLRVRFSGHVQGVGFRATARAIAARSPVSGWVRNQPDGSVVMEIQGSEGDIDAVLSTLRHRMEGMIAAESNERIPGVEREEGFAIRR